MTLQQALLAAFIVLNVALIGILRVRPAISAATGGKALVFLSLFVLPMIIFTGSTAHHLERAKSTAFCLSCHVMEPYGRSLDIDSVEHLPAVHAQNNRVPTEQACYACHTAYTMFGDLHAKLRGMRHVYVNYFATIPDRLTLYEPFANQECLRCHASARNFQDNIFHADMLADLARNETSCLLCHSAAHAIDELDRLPPWKRAATTPGER
jgi:nitrate/TMAO reductase-like tetraheme cytochrome c subunit